MVQADPPRHGPGRALPRPARPGRAADLAGPGPAVDHELIDARGHRRAEGARSSPRACRSRSSSRRRGRRRRPSAAPTSAAAPTARGSASRRRRTGRSTRPAELAEVLATLEAIQQEFNAAQSGGTRVSLADLIVLGGVRGRRAGGAGRRPRGHGSVRPGPHRRDAGADRRRVVRGARADGRTASATTSGRARRCPPSSCCVERANLLTLTAPEMTVLVGGLRVLGRQLPSSPRTACSPTGRDADQRLLREPARHGHGVEPTRATASTRAATAPPAS